MIGKTGPVPIFPLMPCVCSSGLFMRWWPWAGFLLVLGEEKDKVSLFASMRNPAALKGPAYDDR